MGANVWQRDVSGGKSFAVGVRDPHQQQRPGKRKLTWSRQDNTAAAGLTSAANGSNETEQPPAKQQAADNSTVNVRSAAAHTTEDGAAHQSKQRDRAGQCSGLHGSRNGSENGQRAAFPEPTLDTDQEAEKAKAKAAEAGAAAARAKAGLQQSQAEVAALRRKILEQHRRIAQGQAAAATAEEQQKAAAKQQKQERQQRRMRLEAGFAEAFRRAKEMATAEAAARRTVAFADDGEVKRVLTSGNDYEVLRLRAGADAASIRRKYKEMAVALHPDKCRVDGATDAFQRLVKAYQNLLKYAS